MIPLYSAAELKALDLKTLQEENISSTELMERASKALFDWFLAERKEQSSYCIFCGPGNNGGDGLALARMLIESGKTVQVFVLPSEKYSPDFLEMKARLKQDVIVLSEDLDMQLPVDCILIDALFGYGLDRPLSGLAESCIEALNKCKQEKVSIDMPSGLRLDADSMQNKATVFRCDTCLSFEFPKLNFLLPEHGSHVGNWHLMSIGITKNRPPAAFYLFQEEDAKSTMRGRSTFSHKGSFGHGVLLAGSKGKMGAGILAARGAMRSGLGLLSVQVTEANLQLMQLALPEAMCLVDRGLDHLEEFLDYASYSALAIGPGIGVNSDTERLLKRIIQEIRVPMVFDADALTILADNKTWYSFLPAGSILTPHPGEFKRLVGKWSSDQERLALQMNFSKKYRVYLVLKGKYTSIACPDGQVFFNSSGNAGMATAGSGDTLTGILLSLLCQGYPAEQAALLGVYLHGLAGDLAAAQLSEEALMASDLSDFLPKAILRLKNQ